MILHWPQITYVVLAMLGLGVNLAKHGEPQKPHNAYTSIISLALSITLLYFGGFFGGR